MQICDCHIFLVYFFRRICDKTDDRDDVSFDIGDYCVALFSEDSLWYRGRIEDRHVDNAVSIIVLSE